MLQIKNGIAAAMNALGGCGADTTVRRAVCELKALKPKPKTETEPKAETAEALERTISAIVCTIGKSDKLINAVRSLENQTLPRNEYEIIVVCSGAELGSETLEKLGGAGIISVPEPGLSKARNAGAAAAGGAFLTYIDDDAVAAPNLLESALDSFLSHKNAAIIGGRVLLRRPLPDIVLSGHEALWSEFDIPGGKYREAKFQYEFPFGANFSVRHDFLKKVGGFDERYGRVGNDYAGGEETALCFRALNAGYRIGLEPRCSVLHDVDESRFTREHIRRTTEAGIMTTARLYQDGLSRSAWDLPYARERIRIAEKELRRLIRRGADELEIFYKECERDGFVKLAQSLEKQKNG